MEVFEAIRGILPLTRAEIQGPPVPRSPEESPFLRAIFEQPDDVANRLVFADWLEERGDPLAELIRIQCRMAQADQHGRCGTARPSGPATNLVEPAR